MQPSPTISAAAASAPRPSRHGRILAALLCAILAVVLAAPAGAYARRLHAAATEGAPSGEAPVEGAPGPGEAGEAEAPPAEAPRVPRERKRRGCKLTLEPTSALVTAGDAVTLSVHLLCASAPSELTAPIAIYAHRHGAGAGANALASASTEADGSYALTLASVTASTTFTARSPGAASAHAVVKVLPLVTLAGPSDTQLSTRSSRAAGAAGRARNRVRFDGTVTPASAGTQVALQSSAGATGESWRTIGLARVDASGHFSFLHSFRTPGEIALRAVTHPRGATLGASQPLNYVVTQAQNPALTIETSLDPVVSGQAVTISGVAVGAAAQHVTLLARAPGQPFASLATATTDEAGRYSFTVSPHENTAYQVRTATEISTVLFEGFSYRLEQDAPPAGVAALALLTVSGSLTPAPAGEPVLLEQQNGSGRGFHVVTSGVVDGVAHFAVAHTFSRPATYVLRVKVPGGPTSQASLGAPFSVTVTTAAGPPAEAAEGSSEPASGEPAEPVEVGEAAEPAG